MEMRCKYFNAVTDQYNRSCNDKKSIDHRLTAGRQPFINRDGHSNGYQDGDGRGIELKTFMEVAV